MIKTFKLFLYSLTLAFFYSCQGIVEKQKQADIDSLLSLKEIQKNQSTVLFFLSPTCPLCIQYSKTISDLRNNFSKKNFKMIGVFTGKYHTESEKIIFIRSEKINIEILSDSINILANKYNITVTPEVIVLNSNGKVVYQGSIDNWSMALGRKKPAPSKFYLIDALKAIEKGENILVKNTKAIGCLIE